MKSWDQGSVVKNNSKQALNLYIVADRDLSCYSSALSKLSAEPECGAHVNDVLETRRSRAFASCPDARLSNVLEDGSCVLAPAHCLQEPDRNECAWSQLHVATNCKLLYLFVDWIFYSYFNILFSFLLGFCTVNFDSFNEILWGRYFYTWLSWFNNSVTYYNETKKRKWVFVREVNSTNIKDFQGVW